MTLVVELNSWKAAVFCALFVADAHSELSTVCDSGCSGHGTCGGGSSCMCDSPWAGHDCSFFLNAAYRDASLVETEASQSTCLGGCSERGRCIGGTCLCQRGYFGPACADAQCPNNCFSHGACSQGTCLCDSNWVGRQCEMKAPMRDTRFLQDSGSLAFHKAQRAAANVWEVADKLYAAAARENQRDAKRRIQRAIAAARENWKKIPGHKFAVQRVATSSVAFLSDLATTRTCKMGCSGHGACNAGKCLCDKSHTGAICDVQRCPDDCMGKGICLSGKCVCGPGHFGANCDHARCPDDCSGHGYCFNSRCHCTGSFGGANCLLQLHSPNVVRFHLTKKRPFLKGPPAPEVSSLRAPASMVQTVSRARDAEAQCPRSCSSRGSCIKGKCLCNGGFQGSDCSIAGACGSHGAPRASLLAEAGQAASCACYAGWSGTACNVELICPDQSCSGHGICSLGQCICDGAFSGHSCHIDLSLLQRHFLATSAPAIKDNFRKENATSLLSVDALTDSSKANASRNSETFVSTADETLDGPWTASWLQPTSSMSTVLQKAFSATPEPDAKARGTTDGDEPFWHPAVAPPAKVGSILALLATSAGRRQTAGDSRQHAAAWTERPLEEVTQGASSHSQLPKKLLSLLAESTGRRPLRTWSPTWEATVASSAHSSDIDTLLGDI